MKNIKNLFEGIVTTISELPIEYHFGKCEANGSGIPASFPLKNIDLNRPYVSVDIGAMNIATDLRSVAYDVYLMYGEVETENISCLEIQHYGLNTIQNIIHILKKEADIVPNFGVNVFPFTYQSSNGKVCGVQAKIEIILPANFEFKAPKL